MKQARQNNYWLLIVLFLATVPLTPLFGAETGKVFKAGAAVVDTTPIEFPAICNGGFVPHEMSVVNDPLHARALVLDDGENRIALTVVDACGMNAELRDEIAKELEKEIGIPQSHILISSTHCHSAPALTLILGTGPDPKYVPYAKKKIKEAITLANANLKPARIAWGYDKNTNDVYCRRYVMKEGTAHSLPLAFTGSKGDIAQMNPGAKNPNKIAPTGCPDPMVSILALQDMSGKPLAIIGNYSTHYAGAPNISADYFAVFCKKIAEYIDAPSDFVALMTNGTSGDCNCLDFNNPDRTFTMETVGEAVAQAALRAWKTLKFVDWVPLQMETSELTLSIRKPTPEQVKEAKAYIAEKKLTKPKNAPDMYAFDTVALADKPDTKTIKLQAIQIGDLGIGAIPCETYSLTGHGIKAYSPFKQTFVIGLANGYYGYIPTTEQFELGGYNTWRAQSSCLETTAEPKIRAEILRLLKYLK